MKSSTPYRTPVAAAVAVALLAAAPAAFSQTSYFSTYTPAATSVPANSLPANAPLQLSSPNFSQKTLTNRNALLGLGQLNTGNWDMVTANETGPNAGRYLFAPFESGQAGVMRYDRQTGTTTTIVNPGAQGFAVGDASRWTPWGTYLTAEERTGGRLFEVTNPTTAGAGDGTMIHRSIIGRVSHEGLAFDKNNAMYFIDELNGGSIYKFTSANANAANGNAYFAAGQTSVLRVGDGTVAGATGSASWIALTDANGVGLPGTLNYLATGHLDARGTTDLATFKGTNYDRPEDLEIQTLADGSQKLYVATTGTHQVFSLDLNTNAVSLFASRNTLNALTNTPVGAQFANPDNLAIDADGNIYIIEDQPGGAADIWFAKDTNRDGIADSLGRWASLSTPGAEPTGLYFDKFDPNIAYLNVQHPTGGDDRLLQITAVPEPETYAMMLAGLGLMGFVARRRKAN
jgi:uncharacterized protein